MIQVKQMNIRILYIPAISLAMLLSSCNKINMQREFVRIYLHTDNSNSIKNEAIYRKKTLLKNNENKISYLPIIYAKKLNEVSKKKITIKEKNTEFPLPESKISNSYFDTVKPLHDNKQRLLFSQLGIRRCDQRNIANLGIGQRYLYKNWLLGYNVFYDIQASSNHHQRLGIGGELRHNFLFIAINSHYGLTDWQSSNKIDYEENVAHGYDILAQGWLPIYPQLSGKIKFEQFFTKKFTPSRTKQYIKDLFKLTLGVDYKPVPLLTLGIDHSFNYAYAGHGDTKFGVYINYQQGIPLSKLISPAEVKIINQPAENRYRLVERNNDIVLRYRQRARINIRFTNIIGDHNDLTKVIDSTLQGSSYCLHILQCDNEALQMFEDQVIKLATKNRITNFLSCNPQLNNCIMFFTKNIYNNPSNLLNKDTTFFVIQH